MSSPAQQFTGEIRVPRFADYALMAKLAGQLGYPASAEDIARRLAGMQESAEHAVFVAELPGGEIVGWIGVFLYRCIETDARAEVSGLVVDERARSQGIGQRLLERAEQWARKKRCDTIGLRSNVIRNRAHAFYERQGYVHHKTQKSFRKVLKP
ncbi:MAG TPA: GNAT family N-acetyltransferase [Candidatus Limnocylindria bacterium]|nr:GNAT family N-acetyltransferase [Candidatus Limnocylindria bacterium]